MRHRAGCGTAQDLTLRYSDVNEILGYFVSWLLGRDVVLVVPAIWWLQYVIWRWLLLFEPKFRQWSSCPGTVLKAGKLLILYLRQERESRGVRRSTVKVTLPCKVDSPRVQGVVRATSSRHND